MDDSDLQSPVYFARYDVLNKLEMGRHGLNDTKEQSTIDMNKGAGGSVILFSITLRWWKIIWPLVNWVPTVKAMNVWRKSWLMILCWWRCVFRVCGKSIYRALNGGTKLLLACYRKLRRQCIEQHKKQQICLNIMIIKIIIMIRILIMWTQSSKLVSSRGWSSGKQ